MFPGLPPNNRCRRRTPSGLPLVCCLLFVLSWLAGCETLANRLERNQKLFETLPPQHQELIRQGRVQVGFTPIEVYLAWGAPTRKAITESARGRQETWYYTTTQTETYYRREPYYSPGYGYWWGLDQPYSLYREYLYQEAVFSEGVLSSFTLHPSATPFFSEPYPP